MSSYCIKGTMFYSDPKEARRAAMNWAATTEYYSYRSDRWHVRINMFWGRHWVMQVHSRYRMERPAKHGRLVVRHVPTEHTENTYVFGFFPSRNNL